MVIEHKLNNYSSYTVNLAWLKFSTTELQQLEYFKSVFLVILNMPLRTVFAETVTYVAAELGEYLTLQMEVRPRFKCTCYIILQALGGCRQCFYGVSTSATSAMHYAGVEEAILHWSGKISGKFECVEKGSYL